MTTFKQKNFGGEKKALKLVKDHPTLITSTAALGIGLANLSTNTKRQREAKEIANKQLNMMNKQMEVMKENTKAINDSINSQREVSNAFRNGWEKYHPSEVKQETQKRRGILNRLLDGRGGSANKDNKRRKLFSIKSSALAGAQLGFGITTLASGLPVINKGTDKLLNKVTSKSEKIGKIDFKPIEKRVGLVSAGTIVGAMLGALIGSIGELDKKISRGSVNQRLMYKVIDYLRKENFRNGIDYTLDPKIADKLGTRVCIALSRNSGDLRLLINTKADPKLKQVTDRIVRNIPNAGVENRTANNKYNELTISTISDSSADAGLVSGIVSQFIHSGFPVYLVEVG